MCNTFLFWIAVASCVDVCFISAKDTKKNDLVISKPAIVDDALVDTSKHKEFNADRSELNEIESKECTCVNGKCMRFCDIFENLNCVDKSKVCVCNPGFAKKLYKNYCEYCDCGQDFNCFFNWNDGNLERICKCPKGYYVDEKHGDCVAECNDENHCQNGGTCLSQMCICPYATGGSFCEEILDCSDCVNRLELDCLYDRKSRMSYCGCKNDSLFYDFDARTCIPCQCGNGYCEYDITSYHKKLKCNCNFGYVEFNGYCKECSCFGGLCEFDSNGKKNCTCVSGNYEREGICLSCGCMLPDDGTKCEVVNNKKRCLCEEGYQDAHGLCIDIDECEISNSCHPLATCRNIPGSFLCQCPIGYEGDGRDDTFAEPGEMCRDINECDPPFNGCLLKNNAKCTNLPGSYKCECLPGYEPISYLVEPGSTSCVEVSKSWVPAIIVIVTSAALIFVSWHLHAHLKVRAARSN